MQVMETRKRMLRAKHLDTLTSINNFTFTLKSPKAATKKLSR